MTVPAIASASATGMLVGSLSNAGSLDTGLLI
jgi:hypothetical protein